MSPVELPRGRAESIPDVPPVLAEPYRVSPSSPATRRPAQDVDRDCSPDCVLESPSSSTTLDPFPRSQSPGRTNDDMLSVPHMDARGNVPAPALPAKSALRTSRLLASLAQKTASEDRPILPHAAPHQVYLSSEEDASSSADDLSDLSDLDEIDREAGDSHKSASTCRSRREDTARVVTVVFHGRPSIVEMPPRAYGGSTDGQRRATGILRTATEPTLIRTRSNSSSSSTAMHNPPRSSSMTPSGFQMKRGQFLTIDPFATRLPELDEQDAAKTPKTPSGMLKKTLSLVKKRSRPTLNPAPGRSRESLMAPMEQLGEEPELETPREPSPATRPPVTYQGIMRSARRSAETSTPTTGKTDFVFPTTTSSRSRFRSGLSISRPRSVRA
ncbi:hypothetical protein G6O67_000223 [Ophiocordyceps sinensis]|uniref:Uncharacterized protein n=2 Tax=Ophiocordyceps sinensis TaxID=72228 RepID=A0A8H4PZ34_9HYPO|nr:hypothetical protein OCS_02271 [Ophiocordyceps sinensis CO18]KAF4512893.1 hypothetical protein G6O67_000223 [Ophiocordyceps sinensis]